MCVLKISDRVMKQAGLKDEHDALIEFACRLFAARKLSFDAAMEMTGLLEDEFASALQARNIPINYYSEKEIDRELNAFGKAGS